MATTGGQPGNQNAKKAKRWQEALSRSLARNSDAKSVDSGLDKIADQVVTQAFSGDKDAWQEIAQRFDGKVPQGIIGGDEDDNPIRTVSEVLLRAVDAANDRPT